MVTSIMKKRTIRERKKNRRQTIAVWITTCIATALFAAVFSFASSCQAGLIEYAKDLSGDYDYVFYDVPREEADHIVNNRKVATAYQSVGLGYAKLSATRSIFSSPFVSLSSLPQAARLSSMISASASAIILFFIFFTLSFQIILRLLSESMGRMRN